MRLPLRVQLNLSFAAALLVTLAIAVSTWWMAHTYQDEMDRKDTEQLTATQQLAEAESALWQLREGLSRFMLGDAAARRRVLDEEAKWVALFTGRLDACGTLRHSDQEQQALAELRAEFARYIEARPRFFALWQDGRREEAIALSALTTTPYGEATLAATARQARLLRMQGERDEQALRQRQDQVRRGAVYLAGIQVVLIVFAYWLGLRMLAPIRRLRREAVATIREQFGEDLETAANDNEAQALERSLRLMTRNFIDRNAELTEAKELLSRQSDYLEGAVAARTQELEQSVARMERQNREITLRNELSDLLHSCIDMDEAGAVIAHFLPLLFPGASGAAYLHRANSDTLSALVRWGGAETAAALKLTDCWALRRGKLHVMTDAGEAPWCNHVTAPIAGFALCVPFGTHGEAFGLLHLACPCACVVGSATTAEEGLLAEALAAQIGMALANLRLRTTLHEQSIRDALTGLFNRRYLEESLDRELARAVRERRGLAVLMLDVDHFKRFNDDYGHEAGDAVLRALGRVLSDNARAGDLPCRFGGEEFTVVLPGATLESAREWGERLMARVRLQEARTGGQPLPGITVSLGLALYPEHGNDRETLLQAADLALYDAKHAGRDRLAISTASGLEKAFEPPLVGAKPFLGRPGERLDGGEEA